MKRGIHFQSFSLVVLLLALPSFAQVRRTATVQPGTKAQLVLQSRISSKLSEVGDLVYATLSEPIYVAGQMVMPREAIFKGRITAVRAAGRVQKSADLTLLFDRVLAPWGEEPVQVTITAIDDWDNDRKLRPNVEGKVNGGHDGEKTADNVRRGGSVRGWPTCATGLCRTGAANASPGGGAAIAGGMLGGLLLTKGREVQLQPGVILRIQFVKALSLPAIEATDRIP